MDDEWKPAMIDNSDFESEFEDEIIPALFYTVRITKSFRILIYSLVIISAHTNYLSAEKYSHEIGNTYQTNEHLENQS